MHSRLGLMIATAAPVASGSVVAATGPSRATILLVIGSLMNSAGILRARHPSSRSWRPEDDLAGFPTRPRAGDPRTLIDGSSEAELSSTDNAGAVAEETLIDGQSDPGAVDLSITRLAA